VLGNHVYNHSGSFPITVNLHSNLDGSDQTGFSVAQVESDNQHFVENIYPELLRRPVDPTGLQTWTTELDQGVSRTQIVQQIQHSNEYHTDVIQGLYDKLLNRAVDPSGLQTWSAFLAKGGTTEQLQAIIMGSGEYYMRRGGSTTGGWLQAVYGDALNRALDAAGAQSWSRQLGQGFARARIAEQIIDSAEGDQVIVQLFY